MHNRELPVPDGFNGRFDVENLLGLYKVLHAQFDNEGEDVPLFVAVDPDINAMPEELRADLERHEAELLAEAGLGHEIETRAWMLAPVTWEREDTPRMIGKLRTDMLHDAAPRAAAFLSDTFIWLPYGREGVKLEDRPDNLREAFEAGNPDVAEALMVYVVTAWGSTSAWVVYRRGDDGRFVYDEPQFTTPDDAAMQGFIPDCLAILMADDGVVREVTP